MSETWKDIQGYEGFYQVSSLGRVKSLARRVPNNGSYQDRPEKILSQSTHYKNGYKSVVFTVNRKQKRLLVHRLVLMTFNPIEENLEVNHIDGNKDNNCLFNLEWSTRKQNVNHAFDSDLMCVGESHHNTFLKEKEVAHIKFLINKGCSNRDIALKYKVKTSLIYSIKRGRTWKKVKPCKKEVCFANER